jgi:predicted DNA-binding transcriptional regulator AlpA
MSNYEVVRPVGARPTTAQETVRPERRWGPEDVAAFLGVAVKTVYGWRCTGYGPRGRRVGRHVRYDPDEVRAWFDSLDTPEAG